MTRAEAGQLTQKAALARAELHELTSQLDQRKAEVEADFQSRIEAKKEEVAALEMPLLYWVAEHKGEVFRDKKRSGRFFGHEFKLRWGKASVDLPEDDAAAEAKAIAALEEAGVAQEFVNYRPSLNRTACIAAFTATAKTDAEIAALEAKRKALDTAGVPVRRAESLIFCPDLECAKVQSPASLSA